MAEIGHTNRRFPRRQADETLALALAAGRSVRHAAEAAGLSPRTATRRCADPAFRERADALRAEMVSRAVGKLADAINEAVTCLRNLLSADSAMAKLGAARTILEMTVRLRESTELEERIARLECETHERHPTTP